MQVVGTENENLQHDIHHNYQLKVNNGVLKRGVTDRRAKKVLCEDESYLTVMNDFDTRMLYHAVLSADACYWDRCWSSLWIYAFLIHQMPTQNRSSILEKNMRTVSRPPFFAIIDDNGKEFVPTADDHKYLEWLYKNQHCERVGGDHTFGRKIDQWKNFFEKVKAARRVVCRLCEANVFPTDTPEEVELAVVLMSPILIKLSRDGFRGGTDGEVATKSLSDDIMTQVCNIDHPDEYEKIVSQYKELIRKETEKSKSKRKVGSDRPLSQPTNRGRKKRKRGKMDITPELRKQHRLASSMKNPQMAGSHSHSGCWHPTKTQTDQTTDEIDTNNGFTPSTSNADDHDRKNKTLYFETTDSCALPIIVVETYRDKNSKQLVKGPDGKQGDPLCFSNDRKDRLSMVLSCPTTSAYIYCFSMAHRRPHFVWSEQHMESYIQRAFVAASGTPKMILHSRDCLSSPITVNNTDGSINFHMYSDKTEEFTNHFVAIETDFHWWMRCFDKFRNKKSKENVDHRGFSEKIDVGYGRHGCSESTSTSQNRSENIVCALPSRIFREKDAEFQHITRLLDQMTDFMDIHFLDNGCKLFDDKLRDAQFASTLRSAHGGEKFRAEAFTIVRQRLGTIENLKKRKHCFEPTERHM